MSDQSAMMQAVMDFQKYKGVRDILGQWHVKDRA